MMEGIKPSLREAVPVIRDVLLIWCHFVLTCNAERGRERQMTLIGTT
jgi:hypothetical protein